MSNSMSLDISSTSMDPCVDFEYLYRVLLPCAVRVGPDARSARTGAAVYAMSVIEACERRADPSGQVYVKLKNEEGWLFEFSPEDLSQPCLKLLKSSLCSTGEPRSRSSGRAGQ
jgi:hypothetical protein